MILSYSFVIFTLPETASQFALENKTEFVTPKKGNGSSSNHFQGRICCYTECIFPVFSLKITLLGATNGWMWKRIQPVIRKRWEKIQRVEHLIGYCFHSSSIIYTAETIIFRFHVFLGGSLAVCEFGRKRFGATGFPLNQIPKHNAERAIPTLSFKS